MSDDQERRAELAQALIDSAEMMGRLETISNDGLIEIIQEHLMADLDMTGPSYALLDAIVVRLGGSDLNFFELTERQTSMAQQAMNHFLKGLHSGTQTHEMAVGLKSKFTPHSQHGYGELCGSAFCRCCS